MFPAPSVPFLYKSVQAADAEQMERVLATSRAEVDALNAEILAATGDTSTILLPIDWCLAGAGDGHTFVFTVTYVPAQFNFINGDVKAYGFVVAGNGEVLNALLSQKLGDTLDKLIDPLNPTTLTAFWNQSAGAAKGTRLMAGFALGNFGGGLVGAVAEARAASVARAPFRLFR